MADMSTVTNVVEEASYYAQQVTAPYQTRVIGPDITLNLSGDFLVVKDESDN